MNSDDDSSFDSPHVIELGEVTSPKSSGNGYSKLSGPPTYRQAQFLRQISQKSISLNDVYELLPFSMKLNKNTLDKKHVDIENLINDLNGLGCKVSVSAEDYSGGDEDRQLTYLVIIEEETIDALVRKIYRVEKIINNSIDQKQSIQARNRSLFGESKSLSKTHSLDDMRMGLGND